VASPVARIVAAQPPAEVRPTATVCGAPTVFRPTADDVVVQVDRTERELSRLLRSNGIRGGRDACAQLLGLLATAVRPVDRPSAVVLSDGLLRLHRLSAGPVSGVLADAGVAVGVRADGGTRWCADNAGFRTVEPDHLRWRLAEYAALGARFAWWRSVVVVPGGQGPSLAATNAACAVRFVRSCQAVGLVPVVAVDVRRDGSHDIWACADATSVALGALGAAIDDAGLDSGQLVIAAGMVVEGAGHPVSAPPAMVAAATAGALGVLPRELAAVLVSLDGQRPGRLARNLDRLRGAALPWPAAVTGNRVFLDPLLAAWRGTPSSVPDALQALARRIDVIRSPRR